MTHSIVYRIYGWIKKIYMNSRIANGFSGCLSSMFHILIGSNIFSLFTENDDLRIIERSRLFRIHDGFIRKVMNICDKNQSIKGAVVNSYFVKLFTNVACWKDNNVINQLPLLAAITLLFNIVIKVLMGNFLFGANKIMIAGMVVLFLLYTLRLDYKKILKESKVIGLAFEIFNDEGFNNEF